MKGNNFPYKIWEENGKYFYTQSMQGVKNVFLLRKKRVKVSKIK